MDTPTARDSVDLRRSMDAEARPAPARVRSARATKGTFSSSRAAPCRLHLLRFATSRRPPSSADDPSSSRPRPPPRAVHVRPVAGGPPRGDEAEPDADDGCARAPHRVVASSRFYCVFYPLAPSPTRLLSILMNPLPSDPPRLSRRRSPAAHRRARREHRRTPRPHLPRAPAGWKTHDSPAFKAVPPVLPRRALQVRFHGARFPFRESRRRPATSSRDDDPRPHMIPRKRINPRI